MKTLVHLWVAFLTLLLPCFAQASLQFHYFNVVVYEQPSAVDADTGLPLPRQLKFSAPVIATQIQGDGGGALSLRFASVPTSELMGKRWFEHGGVGSTLSGIILAILDAEATSRLKTSLESGQVDELIFTVSQHDDIRRTMEPAHLLIDAYKRAGDQNFVNIEYKTHFQNQGPLADLAVAGWAARMMKPCDGALTN